MNEIDKYLAALPESQKAELERVRKTIEQLVPEVVGTISYGMPTYKYLGKPLVHFAAFKNHMSIFPASGSVTRTLADKLKGFRTSKGTLQFTVDNPVSDALLTEVIQARLSEISSTQK